MKMSLLKQNNISESEKTLEIILQEHKSWPSSELEKKYAKEFAVTVTESDKKLGKFLEEKKIIDFRLLQDKGLEITAKEFIGTVNFSKFKLKIIPKIYSKEKKDVWKNIATCIYFIEGYPMSKIVEFEKIKFVKNVDQPILQEYLIWSLVFQCEQLIQRGLLKSYVTNEQNLSFLRGKIILKNQFVNDAQKNVKFFCEYDELEYDNIDNRIIFHTLLISEKIAITSDLKKNLILLIEQFSGVVQNVPISVIDVDRVMRSYTRQNMHYEDAHRLCKLIMENTGISDYYDGKTQFTVPFFMDMNKIFEEFVTKLFEKYYPDDVEPQKRQQAWKVNDSYWKHMRPDIILKSKIDETVTIVDVKYKPELIESDLYQIGFYIHEFRGKKRNPEENKAFAILPDYHDAGKKNKIFVSVEKKIQVFQRRVSLDNFIELIRENNEPKLKKILKDLLEPELDKEKNNLELNTYQ